MASSKLSGFWPPTSRLICRIAHGATGIAGDIVCDYTLGNLGSTSIHTDRYQVTRSATGGNRLADDVLARRVDCNGLVATISRSGTTPSGRALFVGTSGNDVIIGTSGPDRIEGRGGNDTVCGLGGQDVILGNGGRDWISGGGGADRVMGGSGGDTIQGGRGGDTIQGGRGDDFIRGQRGDDTIRGNRGADTIEGDAGTDTCYGGPGNNMLSGCELPPPRTRATCLDAERLLLGRDSLIGDRIAICRDGWAVANGAISAKDVQFNVARANGSSWGLPRFGGLDNRLPIPAGQRSGRARSRPCRSRPAQRAGSTGLYGRRVGAAIRSDVTNRVATARGR